MSKCLIFDCETATLPKLKLLEEQGKIKNISVRYPIIYDAGWTVCDLATGEILKKQSYIVMETYFNESVFNTAYYKNKRSLYDKMIDNDEIQVKRWKIIAERLEKDLQTVDYVSAYNASFDYKALRKTELYIRKREEGKLENFENWLCKFYSGEITPNKAGRNYNNDILEFREISLPIVDIWAMACELLKDSDEYKDFCINELNLSRRKYFPSNAESVYQFLQNAPDFVEEHTALQDATIETDILIACLATLPLITGIVHFPFKALGTIEEYARKPLF